MPSIIVRKNLAGLAVCAFMSLTPAVCSGGTDEGTSGSGVGFEVGYLYGDAGVMLTHIRSGKPLPTKVEVTYSYGAVHLEVPGISEGFFSRPPGKWSLQWSDGGDYEGKNPALWKGKNVKDYISMEENAQAKSRLFSVVFPETIDIPEGDYTYRFYTDADDEAPAKTLRLSDVDMTDNVNNTTDYMNPFVIFNVDEAGTVTSLEYRWMRHDGTGFVPATSQELETICGPLGGARLHWGTASQGVSHLIRPAEHGFSVTGTIEASVFGGALIGRADIDYLTVDFSFDAGTDVHFFIDPQRSVRTRAIQSYP